MQYWRLAPTATVARTSLLADPYNSSRDAGSGSTTKSGSLWQVAWKNPCVAQGSKLGALDSTEFRSVQLNTTLTEIVSGAATVPHSAREAWDVPPLP